jgi:hypothetical protein
MLTFSLPQPITSDSDKTKLAQDLTAIIEEGHLQDGIPYTPNAGDLDFWTLDSGNNWKLKLPYDRPNEFMVWYRYHSQRTLEASLAIKISDKLKLPSPIVS